jgi:hypothetical protein
MEAYTAPPSPPSPLVLSVPSPLLGETLSNKEEISLAEVTRFFFKRALPKKAEMQAVAALFASPWKLKTRRGKTFVAVESALQLASVRMPASWPKKYFMDKKLYFQRRLALITHLTHLKREALLNDVVYYVRKHQKVCIEHQNLKKSEEAFLALLNVHVLSPFVSIFKPKYQSPMGIKIWTAEMKESIEPQIARLETLKFNTLYDTRLVYKQLVNMSPCMCFKERLLSAGICSVIVNQLVET